MNVTARNNTSGEGSISYIGNRSRFYLPKEIGEKIVGRFVRVKKIRPYEWEATITDSEDDYTISYVSKGNSIRYYFYASAADIKKNRDRIGDYKVEATYLLDRDFLYIEAQAETAKSPVRHIRRSASDIAESNVTRFKITLQMVKRQCELVRDKLGRAEAISLIREYGHADSLSDVIPMHYEALYNAAVKAIEPKPAPSPEPEAAEPLSLRNDSFALLKANLRFLNKASRYVSDTPTTTDAYKLACAVSDILGSINDAAPGITVEELWRTFDHVKESIDL